MRHTQYYIGLYYEWIFLRWWQMAELRQEAESPNQPTKFVSRPFLWPSKCAALYAICRIGGPINPLICSPTKFCLCSQTTYQPNQPAKFSAHYFLLLLSNGLSLLPIFLPATGLSFCVASAMLAAQAFRVWQHSRYRSTDSRCQSTADHGPQIAQHSTAQLADRTAQHSTARHSTSAEWHLHTHL